MRAAFSWSLLSSLLFFVACKKGSPPVVYQTLPVERRDIIVSAQAAGTVQPDTTVEVKSKASGEILDLPVETGQAVKRGDLLALIDPRIPQNTLAQAQADLEVAKARLANATSQRRRADELFKSQSITEQEHEQALLDQANANADVVRAQVAVDNARDQLEDTKVRAPIAGTILAKTVERGQVISSPTRDVGGGTVLLTMADLNLVQVRTLVDETDIGKIQPGQQATITVEAYPNRPFEGVVLKIEPQAQTSQNVTVFPVVVRIDNRAGLLRPGMNAEVEIHIGRRENVLAVPNASLRTPRDVSSAAQVLGLSPADIQRQLAAAAGAPRRGGDSGGHSDAGRGESGRGDSGGRDAAGRRDSTGRHHRGSMGRRASAAGAAPAAPAASGRPDSTRTMFGGRYIVFIRRDSIVKPIWVQTGLTDLDYSEVVSGLQQADSVLLLPSASLVESQQTARERINRFTGGGAVPGMQQQTGRGGAASRSP